MDDPNLQRPSTAPGKIRAHFQSGISNDGTDEHNYTERFKDKIGKLTKEANKLLNDIPEGAEKYYELEQEFEVFNNSQMNDIVGNGNVCLGFEGREKSIEKRIGRISIQRGKSSKKN